MHKLLIEDDEGKTVAVPLIRDEITIGRMEGNTIRLTEQNVSRKHARLVLQGGVLRMEDLGSYNGTSLNGSTLSAPTVLKDGDVVLIGDYRLGIQDDGLGAKARPSSQSAEVAVVAPPVAETLEGQPTIPLSSLGPQTAFSEPPARLAVLGRFMSGTEFVLDRPSQVIGRTVENDIVINHKSISRHHAKVVREDNRYVIVDLESANGVRVGGSEQDRAELQSGDVIELGEIRLRFLSGDGAIFDEPQPWYRGKRGVGLAVGGGLVGVALVAFFVHSGHKGKSSVATQPVVVPVAPVAEPTPPPPVEPVPAPAPPTAAVPPPVPTPELAPKAAEPEVPMADLLAAAKKSALAEKWEEALATVGKALAREPGSAEAAQLQKSIEAEKKNGARLAALQEELTNKNFDAVMQGTADIPDDSMYEARARGLHDKARGLYIVAHLDAAKAKLDAGDCAEARREADLVLGQEAKSKKALAIVKRCEAMEKQPEPAAAKPAPVAVVKPAPVKPVVAAAKPAPRRPAAPAADQASPFKLAEDPKPEPAPAADPDKLIKDAQQAWFRGQYAAAVDSARKALKAKPGLATAYQIIALCSCALHDEGAASGAYERLDERNKQFVKTACLKNGIKF
jgi:pSer/pThr/pTyr-binding forkhead associated (FHA) protein